MKRWTVYFLLLCLLTACHDGTDPAVKWKRVTVVYMMAENSLSRFAEEDLREMRRAMGRIPDSCQLVVFVDNSVAGEQPQVLTMDGEKGEKVLYKYKQDPISTDSATMQRVLELVMRECRAREYGLVMWSHGSGWIPEQPRRTIGVDNGKNSASNIGTEMETETLARILQRTGVRWNYVFFDACFMQGVEVAYQLRHVAEWTIGSPAEIPAEGAPYDRLMQQLFADSDEAWRIAEAYYNHYRERTGVVVSAARNSQMEQLAAATAPLIASLTDYPTDGIQPYMGRESATQWKPEYFDMGSAMAQWFTEEEYALWRTALERAVPHSYATQQWATSYSSFYTPEIIDPDHVAGISMYIPVEGSALNSSFARTEWFRDAGWTTRRHELP